MHSFSTPTFGSKPTVDHCPVTGLHRLPLYSWICLALVGFVVSTHPYPHPSQPARTPSCTRGPSRNLVLPGSDAIAANNCASAYEQTAIRAHSAPNGRVPQRRDAANPDAHALVTRIGSFIKCCTFREGEHALALFGSERIKHTKKGPRISTRLHACNGSWYAATSASAATTAPAAPAINNPGAATMHATAAIYAEATAYAMAIAIAALANDRPPSLLPMSFWMRSMAARPWRRRRRRRSGARSPRPRGRSLRPAW